MSDSIDEKVVAMKLQNSQFEANAKQTLGTLGTLSKALKMDGAVKGLQGVADAAKNTQLGHLAGSVDTIASRFTALGVIGVTALATIANKAVNAGLALTQSLTIAPIKQGFDEYELKLGSIQTMLANTSRYGTKLPEINRNLNELNTYADKTIYNFGAMTKNIGLFTNAGIRIGDATKMIQGFSNVAAASGTSAEGAASAAYQLSQALSAGKITLMDWRSLQNVGMGNANMKDGLLDLAQALGTVEKGGAKAKEIQKDFNGSLKSGWLSSKVMSKYLKIMATDFSSMNKKQLEHQRTQLKGIGLTDKQIDRFIKQQKDAQEAATKVRTFTQLLGTVRESIGSGWSETFENVIANFTEATKLWTGINDSISGTVNRMSDARNKLLKGWAKAGGRVMFIEALKNGFQAIGIIMKSIKDGFRSIFPAATVKDLVGMTRSFRDFTESLKMGTENADRLKRIFAGVFAVLKVGWTIVKGVFSTLFNLFGLAQGGAGGFLELAASVGDFLVKINEWLTSSGRLQSFFAAINTARAAIFIPLFNIVGKLAEAFSALIHGDISGFGDKIGEAFGGLGALIQGVFNSLTGPLRNFLANARDVTGAVGEFLKGLGIAALTPITDALSKLSENFGKLKEIVSNFGFDLFNKSAAGAKGTMSGLQTTGEKIADVWGGIKEAFSGIGTFISPIADKIGKLFSTITDKVAEWISGMDMQDALAVLNAGFFILMYKAIKDFMGHLSDVTKSFEGIGKSISGTFGQLTENLKTMQQSVKADIILKIAAAVGILAASLWVLSTIEPARLATALGGIAALLTMITLVMKTMISTIDSMDKKGLATMGTMVAASVMMLALAGAIMILSIAVKNLSKMNPGELAKGLIAVGALLGALALFTKFADMESASLRGSIALIALSGAVYLLSISVEKLGKMDTGQLIQGGIAIAAIIAMLTGASVLMGKFAGTGPAGLLAMAAALAILVPVVISLGLIPFEVLRQGLGGLAVGLALMTASAVAMGTFGAKAAPGILAMAVAMGVIAGVVALFGNMDMMTLAKGLGALGIALYMMTTATVVMGMFGAKAAPGLLSLAIALGVMAGVVYLFGSMDLLALGIGLGALAVGLAIVLAAGLAAMYVAPGLLALGVTMGLLGVAMVLAGVGFLAFATGFAALAAIGAAGFAVLTVGFMGLLQLIPLAAQQIGLGIRAIAVVISESGPQLVAALATILISLLKAIEKAAPQFFRTMEVLIMGLVNTVTRLIPKLAIAGYTMIMKLLTIIKTFVGPIADKATDLMVAFIRAIGRNVPKLVDAGAKAIIDFLNGIAKAIRDNAPAMRAAGKNIASAIIEGITGGITGGIKLVTDAAKNLAKGALDAAKGFLGIHSPSKEFEKLGKFSVQGFAKGLSGNKQEVYDAMKSMKFLLADTLKAVSKDVDDAEKKLKKLTSARHKDIDAIKQARKELAQARAEEKKVKLAQTKFKTWGDEQKKLGKLADSYDKITEKVKNAQQALIDATKARDDFATSTIDQFNNLPSIDKDTKLSDFTKSLEQQIVDTQVFTAQLAELRKRGLSDAMYKELLSKGTEAMPFAQQLLEGGQTAIDQVNSLGSALDTAAKALGSDASTALYQAGVDAAAGILKGLQSQQAALEKQMDKLAKAMVTALKKYLGIKSPSRVFAQVGDWSVKGLAKGFEDSSSISEKAAEAVGHGTINALRKSLTGLSDAVAAEVDIDPTIRPVLDLTAIKADANQIGSLLGGKTIPVGTTLASARAAAAGYSANQLPYEEGRSAGARTMVFNQYNNSPESLSEGKIYRNTRNQISAAKGALKN